MNFETPDITSYELEIQITIENASIQKKAFKEVLKQLSPQTKQYKKTMEALDKQQRKEWKTLDKEIDQQHETVLTQSKGKITGIGKTIDWVLRVAEQQSIRIAEKLPVQPIRPRRPGEK